MGLAIYNCRLTIYNWVVEIGEGYNASSQNGANLVEVTGMKKMTGLLVVVLLMGAIGCSQVSGGKQLENLLAGRFSWTVSRPLVSPLQRPGEVTYSVKDPSIVRYKGR